MDYGAEWGQKCSQLSAIVSQHSVRVFVIGVPERKGQKLKDNVEAFSGMNLSRTVFRPFFHCRHLTPF